MASGIRLWLDDVRPAPEGWTWIKTVDEAKTYLMAGDVNEASLDHDLGMDAVFSSLSPEGQAALMQHGDISGLNLSKEDDGVLLLRAMEIMREGRHRQQNGYTLCVWMAETGCWPRAKPRVHSANPAGAARMRAVIERNFSRTETETQGGE